MKTAINFEFPFLIIRKKKFLSNIYMKSSFLSQQNLHKNVNIEYYLRENCLDSQPLNGYIQYTSNFLVEIYMDRNTNFLKNFRLICMINKTVRFKRFIDFQYLSTHNFLFFEQKALTCNFVNKLNYIFKSENYHRSIPIDIIPNFFSRYMTFSDNFRNRNIELNLFLGKRRPKKIAEKKSIPIMELDGRSIINLKCETHLLTDFQNDFVPFFPGNDVKKRFFTAPLFAIGYCSVFLKIRPIWTKRIFEQYVPLSLKKYIRKLLPIFCFRFGGINPYKRTWIRFGYDPRYKPESIIYQSFNTKNLYEISKEKKNALGLRKFENKKKEKKTCNRLYEQICDINSQTIKNFIKKKIRIKKNYINPLSGWLMISDFVKIKKFLINLEEIR
nr:transcription factor subunit [Cryptomonas sp.]UXY87527.1 transcription factor subunit [Cryptomonas sp.]